MFVGDIDRTDCENDPYAASPESFLRFIEEVSSMMPNLRHVRLHFDITDYVADGEFNYSKFTELVKLPKVQNIVLEMGCHYPADYSKQDKYDLYEQAHHLEKQMKKRMNEHAVALDKDVQIIIAHTLHRDEGQNPEDETSWPDDWI